MRRKEWGEANIKRPALFVPQHCRRTTHLTAAAEAKKTTATENEATSAKNEATTTKKNDSGYKKRATKPKNTACHEQKTPLSTLTSRR